MHARINHACTHAAVGPFAFVARARRAGKKKLTRGQWDALHAPSDGERSSARQTAGGRSIRCVCDRGWLHACVAGRAAAGGQTRRVQPSPVPIINTCISCAFRRHRARSFSLMLLLPAACSAFIHAAWMKAWKLRHTLNYRWVKGARSWQHIWWHDTDGVFFFLFLFPSGARS
jgi:hypothetical protein